ncbi:hypothetical protein PY257_02870 [Ramlibacter sp. H39-3-26]|uniref:hypothetical protein n=1 Tax=Curvibacter soli TaxID=3031331 RepID=UPI0023D9F987|nr:hypothetical protein [Ramlibacter sp. H39-3-26]MDF1484132.1 hypothetical protein [Ramlibacter sp. H39-3-26]
MLTLSQAVGQGCVLRGFEFSGLGVAPAVGVAFFFNLIRAADRNDLTSAPSALKVHELLAEACTASQRQQRGHCGDSERHAQSSLERLCGRTCRAATYKPAARRRRL